MKLSSIVVACCLSPVLALMASNASALDGKVLEKDQELLAVTLKQKGSVLQALLNIETIELGEQVARLNYAKRYGELLESGRLRTR